MRIARHFQLGIRWQKINCLCEDPTTNYLLNIIKQFLNIQALKNGEIWNKILLIQFEASRRK